MAQGRPASALKNALIASGAIRSDSAKFPEDIQAAIDNGSLKVEKGTTKVRTRDDNGKVINERTVEFSHLAVNGENENYLTAILALVGNSAQLLAELVTGEVASEAALDSRGPDPVEKAAKDYISLMAQFGKTVSMEDALDAVRKMRETV